MAIESQSTAQMKENVERIRKDVRDRATHLAHDAKEKAGEYYNSTTEWVSDNKGKALAVAGLIIAAGVIGYFVTKKSTEYFDQELS